MSGKNRICIIVYETILSVSWKRSTLIPAIQNYIRCGQSWLVFKKQVNVRIIPYTIWRGQELRVKIYEADCRPLTEHRYIPTWNAKESVNTAAEYCCRTFSAKTVQPIVYSRRAAATQAKRRNSCPNNSVYVFFCRLLSSPSSSFVTQRNNIQ